MASRHGVLGLATVLVAGAVACGPSASARKAAESATAAMQSKAVTAAGEVFGARTEAQALFDSARARFLARDNAAAATNLRDAAAFTRQKADKAAQPAKDALVASADELERLATSVAAGRVKSVDALDHATGRAQLADAALHCTAALDAWKMKNAPTTGAELLMITDHFTRGASDLGTPLTGSAKDAVEKARALAVNLTKGAAVLPTDVDAVLSSLDTALHTAMANSRKIVKG